MSRSFPHSPAAFINSIRDEGTLDEACNWLQETWNELVALREAVRPLLERYLAAGEEDEISVKSAVLAKISKVYTGEE